MQACREGRFRHISFAGVKVQRTPGPQPAGRPPVRSTDTASPRPSAEWSLVREVLGRSGLRPDSYRPAPLLRRVPACLRALRVRSPESGIDLIRSSPHHLPAALSSLLIGVTGFFRDPAVFGFLRDHPLSGRGWRGRGIRGVALGVSDGLELYSVAMLLAEAGTSMASDLRGIDCRADAIEHARSGS